jgi:hypothetical protein
MKTIWILVLLAMAANGAEKRDADVVVCLHPGKESFAVVWLAAGHTQRVLASAGISIAWHLGPANYHGPAEVIEADIVEQPNADFKPGALAFATLGVRTGIRIEIFGNRVRASNGDSAVPPILGHVLAHEITHVLEGVDRHSESGVMKAHWDALDYQSMRYAPLPFAEEDIRLLHRWSASRNRTLVATVR